MANVRKGIVPDWRKGAKYHRALLDVDGLVNGREVCVYKEAEAAVLCEGPLAGDSFDHAYYYKDLGEAVRSAEKWDGHNSPPGKWHDYRSRNNGDDLPATGDVPYESGQMRSVLQALTDSNRAIIVNQLPQARAGVGGRRAHAAGLITARKAKPVKVHSGYRTGKTANPPKPTRIGHGNIMLTIEKGDEVVVTRDMARRQIHVEVKRLEGKPLEQITYEALLDMDGSHGKFHEPGTRIRAMEVSREKVLPDNAEPIYEMGREEPIGYVGTVKADGTMIVNFGQDPAGNVKGVGPGEWPPRRA